jgi:Ran GTPase-activating protein (RanGAP) involved in mRNA processing and transport
VQLLTRLLQPGSALTALNLSNNLVRNEGGKHLARELQTNDSLQKLSLRLNCLGDDGCRALLDAVGDNDTLLELSIGCNGAASASSTALAALLRRTRCELRRLDATNNEFGHDDIKSFATSMYYNKSLVQLDLRQNRGYAAATEEIRVLEEALLRNERAQSAAERSDI